MFDGHGLRLSITVHTRYRNSVRSRSELVKGVKIVIYGGPLVEEIALITVNRYTYAAGAVARAFLIGNMCRNNRKGWGGRSAVFEFECIILTALVLKHSRFGNKIIADRVHLGQKIHLHNVCFAGGQARNQVIIRKLAAVTRRVRSNECVVVLQ